MFCHHFNSKCDITTRRENMLDLCYGNIVDACCACSYPYSHFFYSTPQWSEGPSHSSKAPWHHYMLFSFDAVVLFYTEIVYLEPRDWKPWVWVTWRSWVHTRWLSSLLLDTFWGPSPPSGRAWTLCWVCHTGSHNGVQQPSALQMTHWSGKKGTDTWKTRRLGKNDFHIIDTGRQFHFLRNRITFV